MSSASVSDEAEAIRRYGGVNFGFLSTFLKEAGIAKMGFSHYYFPDVDLETLTPAETSYHSARLLNDFFRDMVDVGTIMLPERYDADDFNFTTNPGGNYPLKVTNSRTRKSCELQSLFGEWGENMESISRKITVPIAAALYETLDLVPDVNANSVSTRRH